MTRRNREATFWVPQTAQKGTALLAVPYCYLDVAHVLQQTNIVPIEDVQRWWDGWTELLTDNSGSATGHGYTALKELQRALGKKKKSAQKWYKRSAPDVLPSESANRMWYDYRMTPVIRDDVDMAAAMDLVDGCGLTWDIARARIVEIRSRQSDHAINRSFVIDALVSVFEDFGVYGKWDDVRSTYPIPVGRVQVRDLPPLPETAVELLASAPPDFRPAMPIEIEEDGTTGQTFSPRAGDGGSVPPSYFADLFPLGSSPPPDGVGRDAHERTLTIGRALAEDLGERGTLRTFESTKRYLEWALELIGGKSTTTPRSALEETGCLGSEGKSGVVGQGVAERVENTYRYFLKYGQPAENGSSAGG